MAAVKQSPSDGRQFRFSVAIGFIAFLISESLGAPNGFLIFSAVSVVTLFILTIGSVDLGSIGAGNLENRGERSRIESQQADGERVMNFCPTCGAPLNDLCDDESQIRKGV